MLKLVGKGLIDIDHRFVEIEIKDDPFEFLKEIQAELLENQPMLPRKGQAQRGFWNLTEYGKRQFGLLMSNTQ
jgi:hypothetical protein